MVSAHRWELPATLDARCFLLLVLLHMFFQAGLMQKRHITVIAFKFLHILARTGIGYTLAIIAGGRFLAVNLFNVLPVIRIVRKLFIALDARLRLLRVV